MTLLEIAKAGWRINLDFEFDEDKEWWSGSISKGDFNCPYKGGYNPENGHGVSYFNTELDSCPEWPQIHSIAALVSIFEREIHRLDSEPRAKP